LKTVHVADSARLPSYDELPVRAGAPPGSSWGLWGDDDALGCLNLLTDEVVRRGLAAARRGTVFSLDLALDHFDPPLAGRSPLVHHVTWIEGEIGHDEELSGWNTQGSTQWDGFRHIRHLRHGFYNGVADEDHGVHHWAGKGLVGRAVLADVGRYRVAQGRPLDMAATDPIEPEDVTGALKAQGSTVEPGDILLLRTGWLEWYQELGPAERAPLALRYRSPGLRAGVPTVRLLWDLHIAAIAADNPALEAWPPAGLATPEQRAALRDDPMVAMDLALHFALLPLLGLPIGELWDLARLAEDCAADGRYEALLTSAPLRLVGGVASPANALAVK
jgi:kynurenine formamidase